MATIHLTRCQFLMPFADILREMGAAAGSLLERTRLPPSLEEKANHYVPILQAIDFAEIASRSQGITDFGYHASRRLHYCHLSEKTRTLIGHSPTLLVALQQACKWASIEDSNLSNWIERYDDHVRFCSRLTGTKGLLHLEHSQWLQNIFPIYIGQESSWIDVPIALLSLPNRARENVVSSQDGGVGPSDHDIIATLKLMLPAYLDQGLPALAEIAEMAGASTRSLQRKLAYAGLTYSDLIDTIRFENAGRLLRDTDSKIIEIAFSSGYADPANFTRAFRRISGVTPRQFRAQSRPS